MYAKRASTILAHARKYYANTRVKVATQSRQKHDLAEPNVAITRAYMKVLQKKILCDSVTMKKVMEYFDDAYPAASAKIKKAVNGRIIAARLTATKLLYKALQVRKQQAGQLLHNIKAIQNLKLTPDFGEGLHTTHTLPKLPILYPLLTLARMLCQSTKMEDA